MSTAMGQTVINTVLRIPIRDEQPGSYSESLETIFRVKILHFFDADPGSRMRMGKIRIRDPGWKKIRIRDTGGKHPGSAALD